MVCFTGIEYISPTNVHFSSTHNMISNDILSFDHMRGNIVIPLQPQSYFCIYTNAIMYRVLNLNCYMKIAFQNNIHSGDHKHYFNYLLLSN